MSAKLKGSANWLLQKGSPNIQDNQLTYTYVVTWQEVYLGLEDYDTPPPNNIKTPSNLFGSWTLANRTIVNMAGGLTAKVSYTYKSPEASNAPVDSNTPKYSCSTSTSEIAIERHKDYLTKWNYCLARCYDADDPTIPSWWDDATDQADSNADYKWIKDSTNLTDNWKIEKSALKPGIEAFPFPNTTVTEKRWYSSSGSADNACADVGKKQKPGKTFGLANNDDNWLNMGASVSQEGSLWVTTVNYQYFETIDEDIYE